MDWADKFIEETYHGIDQVFYNPNMKLMLSKDYWDMYKAEGYNVIYDYINYIVTIGEKRG